LIVKPDTAGLGRFLAEQERYYEFALAELRRGRKAGHWMWFVLPQLRGLGMSETSWIYGIEGLEEAKNYLGHPVLGARLRECVRAICAHPESSAETILGSTDALKFRSSLTLFAAAAPDERLFTDALVQFYDGQPDAKTLAMLADAKH
jgi:uncharacterized protein (DUF1810 family)